MAVGVIIGGAFGKIVTSLVNDILMPPLAMVLGKVNFADLALTIGTNAAGEPILWKYGAFIQTTVDFLILALCVFFMVKVMMGALKKKEAPAPPAPAPEPQPTKEEILLAEIRDLLKKNQ